MGLGITSIVFFILLFVCSIWNLHRIEKERNLLIEIKSRARDFYLKYTNAKELCITKNVCLFEFDRVLTGIQLNPEIKLYINKFKGIERDYILEVIEPSVVGIFRKGGLPTSTYALDRMELTEYYIRSNMETFNLNRFNGLNKMALHNFLHRQYGNANNKAAMFCLRKLCEEHKKELTIQMVDENDYKYWFKNSYMG